MMALVERVGLTDDGDEYFRLTPDGNFLIHTLVLGRLSDGLRMLNQEPLLAKVVIMFALFFQPQLEEGDLDLFSDEALIHPVSEEPGAVEMLQTLGLALLRDEG